MELLLEMGVRRSKEFIEKRNIADSGLHGTHQALARLTDMDVITNRDFGAMWPEPFPAAQKEPCFRDATRNDREDRQVSD